MARTKGASPNTQGPKRSTRASPSGAKFSTKESQAAYFLFRNDLKAKDPTTPSKDIINQFSALTTTAMEELVKQANESSSSTNTAAASSASSNLAMDFECEEEKSFFCEIHPCTDPKETGEGSSAEEDTGTHTAEEATTTVLMNEDSNMSATSATEDTPAPTTCTTVMSVPASVMPIVMALSGTATGEGERVNVRENDNNNCSSNTSNTSDNTTDVANTACNETMEVTGHSATIHVIEEGEEVSDEGYFKEVTASSSSTNTAEPALTQRACTDETATSAPM